MRRIRFTIRVLMIVMLVSALASAIGARWRRQRRPDFHRFRCIFPAPDIAGKPIELRKDRPRDIPYGVLLEND